MLVRTARHTPTGGTTCARLSFRPPQTAASTSRSSAAPIMANSHRSDPPATDFHPVLCLCVVIGTLSIPLCVGPKVGRPDASLRTANGTPESRCYCLRINFGSGWHLDSRSGAFFCYDIAAAVSCFLPSLERKCICRGVHRGAIRPH
jgi:hypothetical protein